jgi:hypothetical protein
MRLIGANVAVRREGAALPRKVVEKAMVKAAEGKNKGR